MREYEMMNLPDLIKQVKSHPDFDKCGMLLCHNGVVRSTSRDGREVSGLKVAVDHGKLKQVIAEYKRTPGIIEIICEIADNQDLAVGDDVMILIVAGDIRDTVITVLKDALNAIKTTVTTKTEYFIA